SRFVHFGPPLAQFNPICRRSVKGRVSLKFPTGNPRIGCRVAQSGPISHMSLALQANPNLAGKGHNPQALTQRGSALWAGGADTALRVGRIATRRPIMRSFLVPLFFLAGCGPVIGDGKASNEAAGKADSISGTSSGLGAAYDDTGGVRFRVFSSRATRV